MFLAEEEAKKNEDNGCFADIRLYKRQSLHMILLCSILALTVYTLWYSFSVLIGSKRLDDDEAVKQSTLWSLIGIMMETGGYLMSTLFNFTRNPKKYFLTSQFISIISTALVAYGYFTENLLWARLSNITFGMSVSGLFGAMNPY